MKQEITSFIGKILALIIAVGALLAALFAVYLLYGYVNFLYSDPLNTF